MKAGFGFGQYNLQWHEKLSFCALNGMISEISLLFTYKPEGLEKEKQSLKFKIL